jgi:hypothetical protein
MLEPLEVPSKVVEAVAVQATPWQLTSRYMVRVEKVVETSAAKLCWDLLGLQKLFWAMARLRRGSRTSCLLLGEDLLPPVDVGAKTQSRWPRHW